MKQIGLFFLFSIAISITSIATAQGTDPQKIFENITDVEKLIRQNTLAEQSTLIGLSDVQQNGTKIKNHKLSLGFIPLDSVYQRKENGTLQLPDHLFTRELSSGITFMDTIIINPLYLPMIFTGKIIPDDLSFYPIKDSVRSEKGLLIPQEKTFAKALEQDDFVNKVRLDFYREHPDKITFSYLGFDALPDAGSDKDVIDTFNPFKELISTETSFSLNAPQVDGIKIKRKFWTRNGEHSLQFSQNYFSPNWFKGGTSNFNIYNNHALRFNYRKNKVRFNNTFEWRLSLLTAPDDTLRNYRIADDLLRYNSDFGIDAFGKNWSYSTNVDARTQVFDNHPTNSDRVQSAFLSPLYVSGGIGLKYNLDKRSQKVRHRRVRLSFSFDPASFSYRYVGNEHVDVKRYGIEEGKKYKFDIGSTINGSLIYDFNRYITLNSRLRYFTSYQKVEAELENTLNMALTNALSTRIFLHLRYDDKVKADPKYKHLQVNELLSFGLNYKW